MNALPILARVAGLLQRHKLEVIVIGNAAAALQGAPVTPTKIDFLFRRTPANVRKLKAITAELRETLLRQYFPRGPLWRISRDLDGLQIDFIATVTPAFERARKRSRPVRIVAAHPPVAVPVGVTEKLSITRAAKLEALKKDNDIAIRDLIRRRLAMPVEQRTNFLRKRIGICSSCL
jgi:hypothetical protein